MRAKRFGAVAVVLSLALFGGACSDDDGDDAATTTQPSVAPSVVPPARSDDPRRPDLVALAVAGGIEGDEAECTADALFEDLSEEEIVLVLSQSETTVTALTPEQDELLARILRIATQRCGWTGLTDS